MRRWIALLVVVAFVAGPALAVTPMINKGTKSGSLSGMLDDDGNDFGMFLSASAGYFLLDYIEVGAGASAGFRGSDYKMFGGSVYGEYNFDLGMPIVPYAGVSGGLAWADFDGNSDSYMELAGWVGGKYFFVDYAAITASFMMMFATDDVYNYGEDKMDWAFLLGTKWYF